VTCIAEGGQQLLDVERDAVGALIHGLDDLARCGQPGAEDEGRDQRRLLIGQPVEPDLLALPLAQ
jgi:hypothetical protein